MNPICQEKKLTLDETKKTVLINALNETANNMDEYMRVIYDKTAEKVGKSSDRVLLSAAQISITKYALEAYQQTHGESAEAAEMLRQLTMSRKAFAALQAAI